MALVGFEWIILPALVLILVCWSLLRRHEIAQEVGFLGRQERKGGKNEHVEETVQPVLNEKKEAEVKPKQSGNAPAFFAFITVVIGFLFVFVFPVAGVALIVGGIAGAAVYDDAYNRGDPSASAWALGTFLLLIIVLPIYLYHRSYGPPLQIARTNEHTWRCRCGRMITAVVGSGEIVECSECGERYSETKILKTEVSKGETVRSPEGQASGRDDPLTILKRRLADGRITIEEFERLRPHIES